MCDDVREAECSAVCCVVLRRRRRRLLSFFCIGDSSSNLFSSECLCHTNTLSLTNPTNRQPTARTETKRTPSSSIFFSPHTLNQNSSRARRAISTAAAAVAAADSIHA